jgi:OOP family OmpA-OmpF porin
MKKKIQYQLLFVLVFVGACATTQMQNASTGNPGELVGQLEEDLATAKSNQLDILAPGLYNDANSLYLKAKQALEQGAKLSDINEYVAEGKASLKKAEEIALVSRTALAPTNEARTKALKVGADKLGKPYMRVEEQYMNLTKSIESGDLTYAQKNAGKVQAGFRDLELMAIKNSALGNARNLMADAEKAKVQKIAPTAYKEARQALNEADVYIEQNPYSTDTIIQKAAHAEFMTRRAIVISESSKIFQNMNPESSALYLESLFVRMSKSMHTGDLRDNEVEAQLSTLTAAFKTVEGRNQSLEKDNLNYQAKVADLEQRMATLQGYSRTQEEAKKKLAAEREFNERFNQVQRTFRPDEAEVYKQGNQLVIRLRGIKFPVGRATLTPENYTLLTKVQEAIKVFGQPTVTIEGHTDSSGSALTNLKLSQTRAEAVKTYLVANYTLPENLISAAGYGPDRPLAPNTTPEGRAANRRIDVVITPSQTPQD